MYANNIQFTKVEIQVLMYIFKHFKDRHNARQLARILSLNHAHINKLCHELTEKHLLKKEEIGNSIYFTFDYGNELSLRFMEYILSQEMLPDKVLTYELEKFGGHIIFGCVFGSIINSKDFNDIDVLLVYDSRNRRKVQKMKSSIRASGLIDKPIRYVEVAQKDLRADGIMYRILSDCLVFHNPGRYIEAIRCLKNT